MQSKEEYLVGIYKIFGLALTAPFGKLFLTFTEIKIEDINTSALIYSLFSLILFIIGVVILLSSYDIAYIKGKSKNGS